MIRRLNILRVARLRVPAAAGALLALVLATAVPAGTAPAVPGATPSIEASILSRFEKEVAAEIDSLEKMSRQRKQTEKKIIQLKEESSALHRKLAAGTNVLAELRLKAVLGELHGRLESQSILEGRWETLRRDFEEKALSLLSLYNDRIEQEIASAEAFLDPSRSGQRLDALVDLARKRSVLQERLERYRGSGNEGTGVAGNLSNLPSSRDRESLELALRLLKDRRRDTETRIEQSILQEEETLKEIRLQERMREFMNDVEHRREGSTFGPPGSARRELEWMGGKGKIEPLRRKLQDLRKQREKDQLTLIQLEAYLDQTSYRLKNLKDKGGMRP